jgi:hypothetical protein
MKVIPIIFWVSVVGFIILLRIVHLISSVLVKGIDELSFDEVIELKAYGCIIMSSTTSLMVYFLHQRRHSKVKKRCKCYNRVQIRWEPSPELGLAGTELWQCNSCDMVHNQEYGFQSQPREN